MLWLLTTSMQNTLLSAAFQHNSVLYTTTTNLLYFRVLNHSGSQVHDWLSEILLGPDIRTTQKWRGQFEYPSTLGITKEHMDAVMKVIEA